MRLIDADALMQRIDADINEIITDNHHAIGVHNGLTLAKAIVINAPTIEVPRWIPVTERLPEHKTKVIVCDKKSKMVTMAYFLYIMAGVHSFCIYDEDWSFSDNHVTHWMPLPDAPKDGDT